MIRSKILFLLATFSVAGAAAASTAGASGPAGPALAAACGSPRAVVELAGEQVDAGVSFGGPNCDLTGVIIRGPHIGSVVPPAGQFVHAWADTLRDGTHGLSVSRALDGQVAVGRPEAASGTAEVAAATCGGTDSNWSGRKWKAAPSYFINGASYPQSISRSGWITAINTAAATWTSGKNQCGQTEKSNATTSMLYGGDTTREASVNNNTCTGTDGTSVISGGYPDTTGNTLASTCAYGSSVTTSIFEGDVEVNGVNFQWTTSATGCSNRWDMAAVMAHEFGHFMGFGHVSDEANPTALMGPTIPPCTFVRTMSLGDYRGWNNAYFTSY